MTKHCRNCVYHMSGNPPVCNAMHTPTYDPIECVDWEASETFKTYSGERLDQGQIPIALRIDRGEAMMFGYEIQESIEARRAAIARDTQRQADENESLQEYYRIDRSSPAIALSELRAMCDRHLNPFCDGQELHARSQSTGKIIEFIAIATPNGLKWQYQGAVIID